MTAVEERHVPGSKLNQLLIVLLVAQVGIFLIVQLTGGPPERVKPTKLFAKLDTKSVEGVKIVDANGKVAELAKVGGKWVLRSGADYPVKAGKVDEFLGKLPTLTAGAPVADTPTYHRTLEVHKDKFQREVTLTFGGGKTEKFFLGSSPGLKRVHLRFDGKKPVYAASELSTWDIGSGAHDWVDTEYFKIEKKEIVSLSLRNSHGKINLIMDAEGNWALEGLEPEQKLASSEIDTLLGSVSSFTFQDPISRKAEPSHGLDQPQVEVALVTEKVIKADKKDDKADGKVDDKAKPEGTKPDGEATSQPAEKKVRKTFTFKVGAKKGDDYYFKASSSDYVVTVGSWAAEQLLKKKTADLIEKEDKDKDKDKAPSPALQGLPPGLGGMPGAHGH